MVVSFNCKLNYCCGFSITAGFLLFFYFKDDTFLLLVLFSIGPSSMIESKSYRMYYCYDCVANAWWYLQKIFVGPVYGKLLPQRLLLIFRKC